MAKYIESAKDGLRLSLDNSMKDILNRVIRIPVLDNAVNNDVKDFNRKHNDECILMSVICGSASVPFNEIISKKKFQYVNNKLTDKITVQKFNSLDKKIKEIRESVTDLDYLFVLKKGYERCFGGQEVQEMLSPFGTTQLRKELGKRFFIDTRYLSLVPEDEIVKGHVDATGGTWYDQKMADFKETSDKKKLETEFWKMYNRKIQSWAKGDKMSYTFMSIKPPLPKNTAQGEEVRSFSTKKPVITNKSENLTEEFNKYLEMRLNSGQLQTYEKFENNVIIPCFEFYEEHYPRDFRNQTKKINNEIDKGRYGWNESLIRLSPKYLELIGR